MAFAENFFTDPAAFPKVSESIPWGTNQLTVDFVGGPYLISGLSEEQAEQLLDHFQDCCSSGIFEQDHGVHIRVFTCRASSFKEITESPWEMTFDFEHTPGSLYIAGLHVMAQIDFERCLVAALWTDNKGGTRNFPANIFENIFRMVVTYRLQETGGMLVHSAAVVDDGEAVLFPGRSNDGKSTLSRLSLGTGRTVLSDDMNALTWVDGIPMLEKVPFAGDLGRTWTRSDSYPLKGIFSISKTGETAVNALSPAQIVSLLVASAPYLNADSMKMSELLANIVRLVRRVPSGALGFRKDKDCWPAIKEFLARQGAEYDSKSTI